MKKKIIFAIFGMGIVSGLVWVLSRPGPVMESVSKAISANSVRGTESAAMIAKNEAAPEAARAAIGEVRGGSLPGLTVEENRKLTILSEILVSKNDNDQRLDTELRDFSPAAKRELERKYFGVRAEKRNERGTYVFLIGREIKDDADVGFMKSVLMEKPCLSLENCDRAPEGQSGDEEHLGAINETTANYPQLVAIRALKHRLQELQDQGETSGPLFASVLQAVRECKTSPNQRVVIEATGILKEFDRE